MSGAEIEKPKKWVTVLWITVAMFLEAIIVLWPLECALSGKGILVIWNTVAEKTPARNVI